MKLNKIQICINFIIKVLLHIFNVNSTVRRFYIEQSSDKFAQTQHSDLSKTIRKYYHYKFIWEILFGFLLFIFLL